VDEQAKYDKDYWAVRESEEASKKTSSQETQKRRAAEAVRGDAQSKRQKDGSNPSTVLNEVLIEMGCRCELLSMIRCSRPTPMLCEYELK
jgi:hypothetical protein